MMHSKICTNKLLSGVLKTALQPSDVSGIMWSRVYHQKCLTFFVSSTTDIIQILLCTGNIQCLVWQCSRQLSKSGSQWICFKMWFFPNIRKFTISFVGSGSQLTQVIYLRSLSYLEHWCNPPMDYSGEAILTATSYHRNSVTLSDHQQIRCIILCIILGSEFVWLKPFMLLQLPKEDIDI